MTVNVYPSKLDGLPIEQHPTNSPQTVEEWLRGAIRSYRSSNTPPISVHLNGGLLDPAAWAFTVFGPDDVVDIYPEPKAAGIGAFFVSYGAYIAAAVAVLAVLLMPRPATPSQKQQAQGNPLDEASAKGNKVKPNAVIREVAGRARVYPDYLLPPHRYFETSRQQVIELLLCVGKGRFDISPGQVYIGDTPLVSLGDRASFQLYQPGQSLVGATWADWWHTAEEIGPTSTGGAGLELRATSTIAPVADAASFVFDEFEVSIPAGAGSFPAGWAPGMLVRVELYRNYTVVDGGGGADIIQGDLDELAPFPGMVLEIAGANEGVYIVDTFTPGSPDAMTLKYESGDPAVGLMTGQQGMALGYEGMLYRLLGAGTNLISVERLTDTGATDATWPGFTPVTTNAAIIALDGSNLEGGWLGPFAACPPGEVAQELEVDVMFPSGLVKIGSKGQTVFRRVTVEFQWRDMDAAGAWTSVTKVYGAESLDQIGFTETLTVSAGIRPEVRARRIGAKSTSPQIQETAQWYGLRSRLQAPTSYAGVTVLGLKVAGGNQVSTKSEGQISVVGVRLLPELQADLSWSAPVPSRQISAWVRHVALSIGYSDADLDLEELWRLQQVWDARGDTYDLSVESATTVKGTMMSALRAGFADLTVDRGRIRPARDEPRTGAPEHMYTPQNMTEQLTRQFQAPSPDDFDGVDVEYIDERTWSVKTVRCRLDGDLGRKVQKITAEGVIDRDRAWRIGMRERRSAKYRRWRYEFSTELDALNSRYLGYEALADDVPGYGKSGILLEYTEAGGLVLLRSSEPFTWVEGEAHVIAIRKLDGGISGPYPATRVDDYRLTVPAPLDFVPDTSWDLEPPHLLFGTLERWSYRALITDIAPNGTVGARVTAMNYDVRVYADDDGTAPPE